jgi:zinc transporter ZupT
MNSTGRLRWFWAVLFLGALYFVAGIVFAALAKSAVSSDTRVAWRLAAWVISAVGFAAHIRYEHVRLHSSPRTTAFHAALAVGLGAFALAISASLHARETQHNFPLIAFAIWPVVTALPAFVVALAIAVLLTRTSRSV